MDGGINLFAYTDNDPINFFDPYGLKITGTFEEHPFIKELTLIHIHAFKLDFELGEGPLKVRFGYLPVDVKGVAGFTASCYDDCENRRWKVKRSKNISVSKRVKVTVGIGPKSLRRLILLYKIFKKETYIRWLEVHAGDIWYLYTKSPTAICILFPNG